MMEWTLAILFIVAIILFILSFAKTNQSSKQVEQQIDQISFSLMDEINKLQQQIRCLELDSEITAQKAGLNQTATCYGKFLTCINAGILLKALL